MNWWQEHMCTKFVTWDKAVHFIGCIGAFFTLWIPMCLCLKWSPIVPAVLVFAFGIANELNDERKTLFDWYDVLANSAGILLAWFWCWLWTEGWIGITLNF